MRPCQASALPDMSRSNVSNVTKRFPRIAQTNKNAKTNANWGREGRGCTQGKDVIKLIAATKEEIKSLWPLADSTNSERFSKNCKKTNANLAINVSTHNANLGREGRCCTQGQDVFKLIAPTKRINCSHQRADKVTLTLGGCDSLWALFQESPTTAGRDRPLRWSEVGRGGGRGGEGGQDGSMVFAAWGWWPQFSKIRVQW